MTDLVFTLQLQYANAVFQAAKFQREAQLAKQRLEALARKTADEEFEHTSIEATRPVPTLVDAAVEASQLVPNFSAIARDIDVSPSHVRRVFFGKSTSARVSAAIEQSLRQQAASCGHGIAKVSA